jgi:excisionase family DNA binding protein
VPQALTADDIADRLQASIFTVRRLIHSGRLPAHRARRAGSPYEITRGAYAAFLEACTDHSERRPAVTVTPPPSVLEDVRLYKLAEVADMTGLGLDGLYEGAGRRFTVTRVGRHIRMTRLQIHELLQQMAQEPDPDADPHAADRRRATRAASRRRRT